MRQVCKYFNLQSVQIIDQIIHLSFFFIQFITCMNNLFTKYNLLKD